MRSWPRTSDDLQERGRDDGTAQMQRQLDELQGRLGHTLSLAGSSLPPPEPLTYRRLISSLNFTQQIFLVRYFILANVVLKKRADLSRFENLVGV